MFQILFLDSISTETLLYFVAGILGLGLIILFLIGDGFIPFDFWLVKEVTDEVKEKKKKGQKLNEKQIIGIVLVVISIIWFLFDRSIIQLLVLLTGVGLFFWNNKQ